MDCALAKFVKYKCLENNRLYDIIYVSAAGMYRCGLGVGPISLCVGGVDDIPLLN